MHIADFVSGSFAGACGVAVGYPLDTVKVRIQTQKQFTGIWQCFVATFSKEGVHGFFKGMSFPVTTISLTSSVVFGTYRNCLQCLSQARGAGFGPNTKLEIFLSGLAGGIAQTSVMSPGDIVKVRLQCQTESKRGGTNMPKPKYRGPVHCLLSIIKEEGFMGLYRGALPLMLRDGPSYATYFLTYATICEWLTDGSKKRPVACTCGVINSSSHKSSTAPPTSHQQLLPQVINSPSHKSSTAPPTSHQQPLPLWKAASVFLN
ncbi:hypothetical protein ABVT39_027668 [Epinephelus coioides]